MSSARHARGMLPSPNSKHVLHPLTLCSCTHPPVQANLSPLELQYFRQYDKLLSRYMRRCAALCGG